MFRRRPTASFIPPRLDGKTMIVTGANSGIGFHTSLELAKAGAAVILAVRNLKKGKDALDQIKHIHPSSLITLEELDLASLTSIHNFSRKISTQNNAIDVLINNAGLMSPPRKKFTTDGFELQIGTNYLGHFALTGLLLPLLKLKPSRVINVSSIAHRFGSIDLEDLQYDKRPYSTWGAYCQSKLAMILFTSELQRRSDLTNSNLLACAVHPGWSRTHLALNGPAEGYAEGFINRFSNFLGHLVGQTAEAGAAPLVYAAAAPDIQPGGYYGPNGLFELTGLQTTLAKVHQKSDAGLASSLWKLSEKLTKITYL